MPKYYYKCDSCTEEFDFRHGMKEIISKCIKCSLEGTLTRIPQAIYKLQNKKANESVGDKVSKAIEDNRKLLNEMKKEGRTNDLS